MEQTEKELSSVKRSIAAKARHAKTRGGAPTDGNSSVAPGIFPRPRGFKAVSRKHGKGHVVIGYFPTLQEAKAARKAHIAKLAV